MWWCHNYVMMLLLCDLLQVFLMYQLSSGDEDDAHHDGSDQDSENNANRHCQKYSLKMKRYK